MGLTMSSCHATNSDYATMNVNAIIHFLTSNMDLMVHLDALHLSKFGGTLLFDKQTNDINNITILALSTIINMLLDQHLKPNRLCFSTTASKLCLSMLSLLKWGTTNAKHYNNRQLMAHGLITKPMLSKAAKSMGMQFNWFKCQQAQNQFMYQWKQGDKNLANLCMKHSLPTHHQ